MTEPANNALERAVGAERRLEAPPIAQRTRFVHSAETMDSSEAHRTRPRG
jgi:hypothetical protein